MKSPRINPKDLAAVEVPTAPDLKPSDDVAQPRRPPPFVSVVLSFWNEADVIPELIRQLREVLSGLFSAHEITGWELIFINDASTDHSEQLLRAELPAGDIRLLNMSRNFGVSVSTLAGFHHATGDVVVYMDADLQDPPSVIPAMIRVWRSDPELEVVHTVRSRREGESQLKRALTWLGYKVLHGTSSGAIPVEAGDFKLLSRRVIDHINQLPEARPFVRGLVRWVGFKQASVYYVRNARNAGETKFPILGKRVMLNFLESALLSQSEEPLRWLYYLGAGSVVFALFTALVVLISGLVTGTVPGWGLVFLLIAVLGAAQLMALAIIALYLGNIFVGSRQRPPYILRDCMGYPQSGARAMPPGKGPV